MSFLTQVFSLALQGAAEAATETTGLKVAGKAGEAIAGFLSKRFVDHGKALTEALKRANRNGWRAIEIALAGDSWWDQCKRTLATGEERGFRAEVEAYLKANPLLDVDVHGVEFRKQCLAQLQAARKAGLLDRGKIEAADLARRVGQLSRFDDPGRTLEAETAALDEISQVVWDAGYESLAAFLALRPASGQPLLPATMRYFFQREVESDQNLFQGLAYAKLDALAEGQKAGFAALAGALDKHGAELTNLLGDVKSVVVQTRADVLDVKEELSRQGQQMRELGNAVLEALRQRQLEKRELNASDSLSIRDEEERRLVKGLVKKYRALPADQRKQMPALLNAVGKLEVVSGDFESAEKDFRELGKLLGNGSGAAEAAHNAYRAALERRAWPEALAALETAIRHDPLRYSPFPIDKFEPEKILGAGGFGVAFMCRNRLSGGRVVIKTLLRDRVERDMKEVFREAQTLEALEHPAIIRIRDCDYADEARSRPYFVMDYFPGETLAERVQRHGCLTVEELLQVARLSAEGLGRAHEKGILHRDIKPANLLVREEEGTWQVRLIDFGLALQSRAERSTARARRDSTLAGTSIAGTLDYAAPEQMGRREGVKPGTYSDVYGFAKTCCYALFGTPQPTFQHWQQLPRPLADLFGRCLAENHEERPGTFAAVLAELTRIEERQRVPVLSVVPAHPSPRSIREEPERSSSSRRLRRREVADEPEDTEVVPPRVPMNVILIVGGAVSLFLLIAVGLLVMVISSSSRQAPQNQQVAQNPGGVAVSPFVGLTPRSTLPTRPPVKDPGDDNTPEPKTSKTRTKRPKPDNLIKPSEYKGPIQRFNHVETTFNASPILDSEFPKILALINGPAGAADPLDISRRLAITKPTSATKKSRDDVAKFLNTALDSPDNDTKIASILAMWKWGTKVNVAPLLDYINIKDERGIRGFKVAVAIALGTIGDPRGIEPVIVEYSRFGGQHKDGFAEALVMFGAEAEDPVCAAFNLEKNTFSQRDLMRILGKVGTAKSLPSLERYRTHIFFREEAPVAIKEIRTRIAAGK